MQYIDDCFALLNSDDSNLANTLGTMNPIDEHIQFASKLESNNGFPGMMS